MNEIPLYTVHSPKKCTLLAMFQTKYICCLLSHYKSSCKRRFGAKKRKKKTKHTKCVHIEHCSSQQTEGFDIAQFLLINFPPTVETITVMWFAAIHSRTTTSTSAFYGLWGFKLTLLIFFFINPGLGFMGILAWIYKKCNLTLKRAHLPVINMTYWFNRENAIDENY